MAFNYGALADEISGDPLTRGYSGMTDQQVADDLNTEYRNVSVDTVASDLVVAALVTANVNALAAGKQRTMWGIIGAGSVRTDDAEVKAIFADMFPAGSATRTNLLALATQSMSRANELGLGTVRVGDVIEARAMQR